MAELTLNIHGRPFGISCEDGQEDRVLELADYVEARLKDIARAGGAQNESHLLVLTSLMLADEIFDMRDELDHINRQLHQTAGTQEDEEIIVRAIDTLTERINAINARFQKA